MSPSVRRVIDAAAAGGVDIEPVEYPDGVHTAAQAAAAVGCEVDQIVKSMIFAVDGELVLALTSGRHQVDGAALAALAGGASADRANPDDVRARTGFAIGGVAPFGHLEPIRCWIDPVLSTFDEVWAAAGTPRHVFRIGTDDLIRLSGAEPGDFVRRR